MTQFVLAEAQAIPTLDQAIIYAIVLLERTNRSSSNVYYQADITRNPESVNFVTFNISRSSTGLIFNYQVQLGLFNPNPLKRAATGIYERISSNSPFLLTSPEWEADIPRIGTGTVNPTIPTYCDTLERYLCWLLLRKHAIVEWIRRWNALASQQKTLDDVVPDTDPRVDPTEVAELQDFGGVSGFYPVQNIMIGQSSDPIDQEFAFFSDTQEEISDFINDSVESFLSEASNNPQSGGDPTQPDVQVGGKQPDLIPALNTCKEADSVSKFYVDPTTIKP